MRFDGTINYRICFWELFFCCGSIVFDCCFIVSFSCYKTIKASLKCIVLLGVFHLLKVLYFTKNSDNSLIFIHFLTHTKRIYLSVQFVLVTIFLILKNQSVLNSILAVVNYSRDRDWLWPVNASFIFYLLRQQLVSKNWCNPYQILSLWFCLA
jgi:hypothetical protein